MKLYRLLLMAALAAAPSMVCADDGEITYGWCEVKGPDGNYLMSGILQHRSGPDRELNEAFAASVGSDDFDGCRMYYRSPSQAESERGMRQYVMKSEEKLGYTVTGWTGKYGVTGEPQRAPSGPYLTVTSTKPAAPAGPSAAELRAERHRAVEERNRAAEAKYEAGLAAVEQAKRDIEARKAANRAAADKVLADHARDMEVHAQQVRMADAANLEYKKTVAKPYGVPNAVYRGFNGRDCAEARVSAVKGAGTDSGTQFKEVESEMVGGGCIVRGWWWSTQKGGASRQ